MFTLPKLPYEKHDLEPYISSRTIEFHYGKHHQAYIDNLNNLITGTDFEEFSLKEIMEQTVDAPDKVAIFNNAGQVFNHDFYWNCIKKNGGGAPEGKLHDKILDDFGLYLNFVQEFKTVGTKLFGSGWVWLVLDGGKLRIVGTSNAGNPITDGMVPLLVVDVWEHAYYLDYQNDRKKYIDDFLNNLVNWKFVQDNYIEAA
ncbi:MAG: superoxide dismutase [bacterium]